MINRHFEQHHKIAPKGEKKKKKKKKTKLHVNATWHVKGTWAGIKIKSPARGTLLQGSLVGKCTKKVFFEDKKI